MQFARSHLSPRSVTGGNNFAMPPSKSRPRLLTAALLLLTIALGLASRRYAAPLPHVIAAYAGDALWAAMVYWIAAFILPRAKTRTLAAIALSLSFAVELSQLYQAPWINEIRATRLGVLALGHGFLWSDLVCYAAGVTCAAIVDAALMSVRVQSRQQPREPI